MFSRLFQIISPVFVMQIKKSLGINPGDDVELALQDSTQGMYRRVHFPSPWGEGRFAYGTNERERAARNVPGGPTPEPSNTRRIPQPKTGSQRHAVKGDVHVELVGVVQSPEPFCERLRLLVDRLRLEDD
ncbi:hypothetical protein BKA70DRAFT_1442373 [Coprinopsis sp. MPI-PUGE-AT-0042]|nr:hypothetical protein BKA70DRAFT_1442373 [Coprinopsis sp. MPI-PUGE-AT-0042]